MRFLSHPSPFNEYFQIDNCHVNILVTFEMTDYKKELSPHTLPNILD